MLRLSKTRFYLVPVVMRTVDILEFLYGRDVPLKTREISVATGIPQTTTYRILRTLVYRGYVSQDFEGRFSIPNSESKGAVQLQGGNPPIPESLNPPRTKLSGEQVIEIVHSVLHCLRNGNDGNLVHEISEGRSGDRDNTDLI